MINLPHDEVGQSTTLTVPASEPAASLHSNASSSSPAVHVAAAAGKNTRRITRGVSVKVRKHPTVSGVTALLAAQGTARTHRRHRTRVTNDKQKSSSHLHADEEEQPGCSSALSTTSRRQREISEHECLTVAPDDRINGGKNIVHDKAQADNGRKRSTATRGNQGQFVFLRSAVPQVVVTRQQDAAPNDSSSSRTHVHKHKRSSDKRNTHLMADCQRDKRRLSASSGIVTFGTNSVGTSRHTSGSISESSLGGIDINFEDDAASCFGQRTADQAQPIIERAEEYNVNRRPIGSDDDNFATGRGGHLGPSQQVDTDFRPYDSQSQYSYYQHFYRPNQRNKNLIDMLSSMKLRSTGRDKQRKAEDNEITSSPIFYSFVRPCAAEFLGTIFYVYFTSFGRPLSPRPSEIVCIGILRAACTLMSMLILGHISGGHFNPVVTVAAWLSGGTRTVLSFFYIFVQFFGAFMGSLLFRLTVTYQEYDDLMGGMTYVPVRPPNSRLLEDDVSQPTRLQAVMLELVISYVLCLAYVLTMVDTDGRCATDGPIATAGATLLGTMAAYSTTRASMNPAKSFASACVFAIFRPDRISWDFHYIYWIGPISGALLAAVSYRCLLASDDYRIFFTREVIKSEDDDNESQNKMDANEAG